MSLTRIETTPQSSVRNPFRASSAVLCCSLLTDMSGSAKARNVALPSGFMFCRGTRRKRRSSSLNAWLTCLGGCVVAIEVSAHPVEEPDVARRVGRDGLGVHFFRLVVGEERVGGAPVV